MYVFLEYFIYCKQRALGANGRSKVWVLGLSQLLTATNTNASGDLHDPVP